MSNITIDVKTHVIITHTGSHYFITEDQNKFLEMANLNDMVEIDGSKIKVSGIAEIMTIQQYYETFPEKKPDPISIEYGHAPTDYKGIHDYLKEKIDLIPRAELQGKYNILRKHVEKLDKERGPVTYKMRETLTLMHERLKR